MPSQALYDIALKKNINNIARDIIFPVITTSSGMHDFTTSNLHPPAIALDISAINQDVSNSHNIYLDGIAITVSAGSSVSIQNIPFVVLAWDAGSWIIKVAASSQQVLL